MKATSLLNFKGGTGKSSVAQNLAAYLASEGHTCLLLDGDRQSNTTTTLLGQRLAPSVGDVITGNVKLADAMFEARKNLYVVPSDTDLDHTAAFLHSHRAAYYALSNQLHKLDGIEFAFIDHAGAYNPVMEALLLASDGILIPCELEPYAVQGLFDMFEKLKTALPDHELQNYGIIPYNTNFSRKITKSFIDQLTEEFGAELVTPPISTDTAVFYAQDEGLTVFEYACKHKIASQAAKDFVALAQFFLTAEVPA